MVLSERGVCASYLVSNHGERSPLVLYSASLKRPVYIQMNSPKHARIIGCAGIFASILLGGVAHAQNIQQGEDMCIATLVKRDAAQDLVSSPRGIVSQCACIANRVAAGMSANDCTPRSIVRGAVMRQNFSGPW